jgi:hypothetical protein
MKNVASRGNDERINKLATSNTLLLLLLLLHTASGETIRTDNGEKGHRR